MAVAQFKGNCRAVDKMKKASPPHSNSRRKRRGGKRAASSRTPTDAIVVAAAANARHGALVAKRGEGTAKEEEIEKRKGQGVRPILMSLLSPAVPRTREHPKCACKGASGPPPLPSTFPPESMSEGLGSSSHTDSSRPQGRGVDAATHAPLGRHTGARQACTQAVAHLGPDTSILLSPTERLTPLS